MVGGWQRGLTVQFERERRLPAGIPVAHHHEGEVGVVALDHVGVNVQLKGWRGKKGLSLGLVEEVSNQPAGRRCGEPQTHTLQGKDVSSRRGGALVVHLHHCAHTVSAENTLG